MTEKRRKPKEFRLGGFRYRLPSGRRTALGEARRELLIEVLGRRPERIRRLPPAKSRRLPSGPRRTRRREYVVVMSTRVYDSSGENRYAEVKRRFALLEEAQAGKFLVLDDLKAEIRANGWGKQGRLLIPKEVNYKILEVTGN
jgi:hypothetical protein